MKKVAKRLWRRRHLFLNWPRAQGFISTGVAEGLHGVLKLPTSAAFGFHAMGRLPEPEYPREIC